MDKLFAVCALGLEPFLAQELTQQSLLQQALPYPPDDLRLRLRRTAGAAQVSSGEGGVAFQGFLRDIYRANLWLRTASRVIVRLGEFQAGAFPELRRKASRLPWEHYLAPRQPVALHVTCIKSRLYHSGAVAERVAGAIADRLGEPSSTVKFNPQDGEGREDANADTDLPQLIIVRLANDHCTISVDSSGALLHRRGYRLAAAKAPLRETLAAGMLMASDWNMTSPLLDPFCGSGTIPIEAVLMARHIAPGHARRFAFMDWPNFDAKLWAVLSAEAGGLHPGPPPSPLREERGTGEQNSPPWSAQRTGEGLRVGVKIFASDRDAGAIRAAQANAERAGVADCIKFACRAVSAIEPPPGPGWVVTNPPYGVRVSSGKDLRNLYARFGNVLREKCPGWRVAMLREADNDQLIRSTGLPFDVSQSIALVNGGLKVKLQTCQI